jgi:hypothetical protein
MTVSVLIPFTSDEPWRLLARDHVVGNYRSQGFDVVEGGCPGPWRKAVAVAAAAARSSGEILVVADADCFCAGVHQAVTAVEAGAPWAMPHELVHRLDQTATGAIYAGAAPWTTMGRTQPPYRGFDGGGIVVLPRATWEQIPLDPRFEGWGNDDEAWALALTCVAGPPTRVTANLYHLYHPEPVRLTRHIGSAASKELLNRYLRAARAGRPAMRALLDEVSAPVMVR